MRKRPPPHDPLGPYVPLENVGKSGAARSRNPFDLENLRLNDAYTFGVPEAARPIFVPLEKPHNKDFIRVNPDPAYQLCTLAIVAPGQTKELYLLHPDVAPDLAGDAQPYMLFTAMGGARVPFVWPCRWATLGDDSVSTWHTSALEAANLAMTNWVRVIANMAASAYFTKPAENAFPEPVWPTRPFSELLEIAFRRRYIDNLDHPVAKRLRGAL